MAKTILAIPEEKTSEVITVIRAGLDHSAVSAETRKQLKKWCNEKEAHLNGS